MIAVDATPSAARYITRAILENLPAQPEAAKVRDSMVVKVNTANRPNGKDNATKRHDGF